jgi:hypothetical protein
MAEIVGGLFGVTPESLQAQRDAAVEAQALQYARLDPFQQAQMSIYSGANKLGGGIAGLLGAQDPEMMRIQQRQSMLQNLDLSSPESLKQGIQTAMQNKDYQLVSELTNRYQASAKAALEGRKTEAEIAAKLSEKLTPEMKNAQSAADMSGAARGSEEWNKTFNAKFNELLAKNPSIDNIGVAVGSQMPVYFDKNTNQQFTIKDGKRVAYNGGVDRTTAKVTATATTKAEDAYSTELGQGLGKEDLALRSAAKSVPESLRGVSVTRDLLDSGKVLTGTGANVKLNVLALGQSLGVTGKNADEVVANTQQLQQQRSKAVLNQIKQSGLGTGQGFTDKDLAFLQDAAAGRITLSPETLKRQLDVEERVFKATASEWNDRVTKINPKLVNAMGLNPVTVPTPAKPTVIKLD